MLQKLVVGVDGDEGSRRALEWAIGRAQELDAEIVAVFALRQFTELVMSIPPLPADALRNVHEMFESDWCRPLRTAGVKYRTYVVEEDPAHGLVAAAAREHADMLVLGANSHGHFTDRLLGGVTYKVAHRAHCPVVIVPGDEHAMATGVASR